MNIHIWKCPKCRTEYGIDIAQVWYPCEPYCSKCVPVPPKFENCPPPCSIHGQDFKRGCPECTEIASNVLGS